MKDKCRLIGAVLALMTVFLAAGTGAAGTFSTRGKAATAPPKLIRAKGTSIPIGFISNEGGTSASSVPDLAIGGRIATAYANRELGGIAGRPIKLVECKSLGTAEGSVSCANTLVADKVAAVVIGSDGNGDLTYPIISGAGIPYTALRGNSPKELTGSGAYLWSGGAAIDYGGMAAFSAKKHWKSFTLFLVNVPAAMGAAQQFGATAFKNVGVSFSIVPVPYGVADAGPLMAAASQKKPDAMGFISVAADCISLLKAYKTFNAKAAIVLGNACTGNQIASQVSLEGDYVVAGVDTLGTDAEGVLYRKVVKKYSPQSDFASGQLANGYGAVLGLVRALKGMTGRVNPATVTKQLNKAKNILVPVGGGNRFSCNHPIPQMPASCSSWTLASIIKGTSQPVVGRFNVKPLYK